jgi:hypothetical protein
MAIPEQLISRISQESSRPASPAVHAIAKKLLALYGSSIKAILFYGSCLRTGEDGEGLLDLYVLVDNYRSAYGTGSLAFLNKLLPPNVYYLEWPFGERLVRAKYAVLSLTDFQQGTTTRWFHSYLWGRFAQPVVLLYASDDQVTEIVHGALAQAVITFISRVMPQVSPDFTSRELWHRGLVLSYRAELRAERPDALVRLFDAAPEYFENVTRAAMDAVPFSVKNMKSATLARYRASVPASTRYLNRLAWSVRFVQGKVLSLLRLLKGLLTFKGGSDYVLWKIERHSGVTVERHSRLRRYPVLGICVRLWRLYRQGAFQ